MNFPLLANLMMEEWHINVPFALKNQLFQLENKLNGLFLSLIPTMVHGSMVMWTI